jgi:hypothetical protein
MALPRIGTLLSVLLLLALAVAACAAPPTGEEFVGPLPGWTDLKREYGAIGDGKADDTAAFQKALTELGKDGRPPKSPVLYLPAGVYRITAPLQFIDRMDVAVHGEHPARVRVVYDGSAGEPMLHCVGVSYSKFSRITWDGAKRASAAIEHSWDGKTGPAVTYMEHSDEVFQDAGVGLRAGTPLGHFMDAETLVRRCKFLRCTQAGLSIQSFNALDWWLWDCEFVDCRIGATNALEGMYGGGHFHIYQSVFRRSTEADIHIGHAQYFGLRFNTSIGSKRFVRAIRPAGMEVNGRKLGSWTDAERYGAEITLQDNTILDPGDPTPIQIAQHGPLILLDNRFIMPVSTSPVVRLNPPAPGAMAISVGNRYPGTDAVVAVNGRVVSLEDTITSRKTTRPLIPSLPATPELRKDARIFAFTPKATTVQLQAAIDEAAKLNGQRPIVYLAAGRYNIDQTLHLPAKTDLQFIGDGCKTILTWGGPDGGDLLHITGPTHARLRDFIITGIWNEKNRRLGRGIVVENVDQSQSQILLDQAAAVNCVELGYLINGLRQANMQMIGSGAGDCGVNGLRVVGSGDQSPWVRCYGGATSNNGITYDVRAGGKLLIWDTWYETAVQRAESEPRFLRLTDRGTVVFSNGHVATLPPNGPKTAIPAIALEGFAGKVTLLGLALHTNNAQIALAGDGAKTELLMLGGGFDHFEPKFSNNAKGARAVFLANKQQTNQGPTLLDDQGVADSAWLLQMLAPLRTVTPHLDYTVPAGATDLRFARVGVRYRVGTGWTFGGAPVLK